MKARDRPEPVGVIKIRRDTALAALVGGVPYIQRIGVRFDRRGDELTALLPFKDDLVGNPLLPALHGGAIAAFLEIAAIIELAWSGLWEQIESGEVSIDDLEAGRLPRLPKTIDFTTDFLRSGLPRDAYARARVNRSGRRYASVHVEAWQDNRNRLFAQATGHFLMPDVGPDTWPDTGPDTRQASGASGD
ncbi:MAG: PaaI family thioesterase [Pseudomonadota bacterium]